MHVKYDINTSIFKELITPRLTGGGEKIIGFRYQRGYGLGYCRRQRGTGLGSILQAIWRFLKPYVKDVGKKAATEGFESGARILSNIAKGTDIKEAVVTEGTSQMKRLAKKMGTQKGEGIGKKKNRIVKRKRIAGRSVRVTAAKRRRRLDSLGFY